MNTVTTTKHTQGEMSFKTMPTLNTATLWVNGVNIGDLWNPEYAARIVKAWNLFPEFVSALERELSNRESTWDADDIGTPTYEAIQNLKALIQKAQQ